MSDIAITFSIVAAVVVLFVSNRIPVVLVAIGTPMALYLFGVLDVREAVGGFGDPIVAFLASLFVVSAGLEAAGVTTWAGQLLAEKAGASQTRLLVLVMLLAALLSALVGFVGTTAALLPVAVVLAVRLAQPTSRLLMPLAFAASTGGLLTLTGSPVNVIALNAAEEAGVGSIGYFEFAYAGVPLLVGMMAIMLLVSRRLLPERNGDAMPADLSAHARTLVEQYRLESGLHRLRVRSTSRYVAASGNTVDVKNYPGLSLVAILDGKGGKPLVRAALAEDDVLLVRGDAEVAGRFATDQHLAFCSEPGAGIAETLFNRYSGLAEVVIPPRSDLIGRTIFPGMVTRDGQLIVLAVQRHGEDMGARQTELAVGDHVLLQGTWEGLDRKLADPGVLFVDSPDLVRRQAVPLGAGAKRAIGILVVLVVLLVTAVVPPAIAGMLCACAMVLSGVLTVPQAYKGVDWTSVILIGGMIPLSTAMTSTGAADLIADKLLVLVGDAGPTALLAGLFVLTCVLGQLISNTATALIIFPIAIAAAIDLGISPRPVIMSVTVAAAASFLTPVATPPNLMVMGPGGYQFGDYWKLGLPCTLWFFVVAVFVVPLIWRF